MALTCMMRLPYYLLLSIEAEPRFSRVVYCTSSYEGAGTKSNVERMKNQSKLQYSFKLVIGQQLKANKKI
jgi:hypothetical protein